MTVNVILLVLLALTVKHFILDFVYQPPFMWQNKGTYGHPGGVFHSWGHCIATFLILLPVTTFHFAWLIAIIEFLIHYHMDWFKMWYNKKKGWAANTHNEFWILMGFDQMVHSLTYILIVYLLTI